MDVLPHASYYVLFSRDAIELIVEGMNELKYGFLLRGYLVWNLHVVDVNPMTCLLTATSSMIFLTLDMVPLT